MHAFALADAGLSPIPVRAEPSGLAVHDGVLFVADGATGAVLRIIKRQQSRVATIESGGAVTTNRLGGIATDGGALFVSRLGPRANAIFQLSSGGTATPLPRLDPELVRLGLALDPYDRVLYATQFAQSSSGAHSGSILEVDLLDGHSSILAGGFTKPVGVVKVGASLVVIDAHKRAAFRIDLRSGRAVHTVCLTGDLDRPDAICALDDTTVLISSFHEASHTGSVKRVSLDGKVRELARGPWESRGIATDGSRIYVAAHGANRILVFDAR